MQYNLDYISPQMRSLLQPGIDHNHFSNRRLSVKCFDDAYIMPYVHWTESIGGVADKEGVAVVDSRNIEWKESFDPFCDEAPIIKHKKVIYLGVILLGFGHVFTDDLRKLWFLKTNEYKTLINEGFEVIYTTDHNAPLPKYAVEILAHIGFDVTQFSHITQLTQFDEIVLPDNSFYSEEFGRCYTMEYVNSMNEIKGKVCVEPLDKDYPRKVYLSRNKYSMAKESLVEIGEQELERQFVKKKYTSIIPEDLSFGEQVQLARHCEEIVATEGSVAHISAFCRPGTHLTILCKARYLNFHQVAINQFADLNITYVETNASFKAKKEAPWHGPFYLCITHYLERYFGCVICHVPYWLRISFWKYMRIIPRFINKVFKLLHLSIRY